MDEETKNTSNVEKEFLYVGYYISEDGDVMLKIGTTNNLKRRRTEHNRNYRNTSHYTMGDDYNFTYLWHTKLSKYNTLRYEDKNRQEWQNTGIGEFVRNDRFVLERIPDEVTITIRKTYHIPLPSKRTLKKNSKNF